MTKHVERRVVLGAALLLVFSGATIAQQSPALSPMTDNMFTVSGFKVKHANTPEKLARLRALPADRLVTRKRDGKTYYLYADPNGCICVYVGTPEAWQTYQNGGPPGYVGGDVGRSSPRFSENQMIDEIADDGSFPQAGAPSLDDYIFGDEP